MRQHEIEVGKVQDEAITLFLEWMASRTLINSPEHDEWPIRAKGLLAKLEAGEPTVKESLTVETSGDEVERVAYPWQDVEDIAAEFLEIWHSSEPSDNGSFQAIARKHLELRDEALAGLKTEVHGLTESLRAASKIGQEAVARAEKAELERDTLQKELEAIRNAPQDYTQHENFGECGKCEHRFVHPDDEPCVLCSHADRDDGTSSNWRPKS